MLANLPRKLADQPHLLLMLTTLFWAGNGIAGKFALGHVTPMVLTFSRWVFAIVIVCYVARKPLQDDWQTIKKHIPYLLIMGAAGFTGFNVLFYSALQYTSVINAAIEQAALPLVIFVANLVLFHIAIRWLQIVGFGLSLIGVLITISGGDWTALVHLQLNRGDALMLAAILCYAGYAVALRNKPELHWMSFFACLVTGAFIASIPAAIFETVRGDAIWPTTLQGFLVVLYAGIFPSILSQSFYIRGTEKLGANRAGMYIMLVPFFGVFLAVMLLGEAFQLHDALALLLVTGGIYMAQRAGPRTAAPAASNDG